MAEGRRIKSIVSILVRLALGLGALVFVLTQVQFHDRVRTTNASGEPEWIQGTLLEEAGGKTASVLFKRRGADGEERVPVVSQGEDAPIRVGLRYLIGHADAALLWAAFGLLAFPALVVPFRWRALMRAVGLDFTTWRAFKYNLLGNFCNNIVPAGAVGGDLIKAYYAAKVTPDARTRAVLSVFVDRIIGLFAMVVMAVAAFLTRTGDAKLLPLGLAAVGIFSGGLLFFLFAGMPPLQRLFGLDRWIGAGLPGSGLLREGREAFLAFRGRPGAIAIAFVLSWVNWALLILANVLFGKALGVHLPIGVFFVVVPLAALASSVPGLPGGWGVGELAYALLFAHVGGIAATTAVAMSVCFRLSMTLWALPGVLVFITERAGTGNFSTSKALKPGEGLP